MGYLTMRE